MGRRSKETAQIAVAFKTLESRRSSCPRDQVFRGTERPRIGFALERGRRSRDRSRTNRAPRNRAREDRFDSVETLDRAQSCFGFHLRRRTIVVGLRGDLSPYHERSQGVADTRQTRQRLRLVSSEFDRDDEEESIVVIMDNDSGGIRHRGAIETSRIKQRP